MFIVDVSRHISAEERAQIEESPSLDYRLAIAIDKAIIEAVGVSAERFCDAVVIGHGQVIAVVQWTVDHDAPVVTRLEPQAVM